MAGTRQFLHRSLLLIVVAVMVSMITGCGSTKQLASRWSESPIRMDGNLGEWSDSTVFVEKEGIRYAVANDGDYLYLCLLSSTPNFGRQLMVRGMTVWIDPNGGSRKTIGVRFPIGGMGMGRPEIEQPQPEPDVEQRGTRFEEMERQSLNEFEYLGPAENDRQRVSRLQGQGLEIQMTATPERFVYKLKLPLQYSSQHPYSAETRAGAKVGIGLESNAAQKIAEGDRGGEGTEGGMPGTGGGRSGGRSGARSGGMGRGGQRPGAGASMVNFNIWSSVQLAAKGK
jgi:hypothetical protein